MKKYAIFDIDGTLNQTHLYVVEAYQRSLKPRGIEVSKEQIISCIGNHPVDIARMIFGELSEKEFLEWRKEVKGYQYELMETRARTFDGISEVLQALKNAGYGLAICSNAFPEQIDKVLEVLGISQYFDEIACLEMGADKIEVLSNLLEKLQPEAACLVGDRRFDLEAARANAIPLIGCAYGYAPDEIREADVVVEHADEIAEAVKKLLK